MIITKEIKYAFLKEFGFRNFDMEVTLGMELITLCIVGKNKDVIPKVDKIFNKEYTYDAQQHYFKGEMFSFLDNFKKVE